MNAGDIVRHIGMLTVAIISESPDLVAQSPHGKVGVTVSRKNFSITSFVPFFIVMYWLYRYQNKLQLPLPVPYYN